MGFHLFDILWGIGIGIIISLPLGPVALITMKRSAEHGLRAGIISGLAVVLIDTLAAIFILLGLHHSRHVLHTVPGWFLIIGSIIVFFYGLRMVLADPLETIDRDLPWHKHFFASILLSLTNPSTYLSFGVIGLFLSQFIDRPFFARAQIALGFFIGAFLWWSALVYVAYTQRERYEKAMMLNKAVGIIIMVLSITTFGHAILRPHASLLAHIQHIHHDES